jgi:hypothetical protein
LHGSGSRGLDERFGRIDSHNAAFRADYVQDFSYCDAVATATLQDRRSLPDSEIAQHPLPRVPEGREACCQFKHVTDAGHRLGRQLVKLAE